MDVPRPQKGVFNIPRSVVRTFFALLPALCSPAFASAQEGVGFSDAHVHLNDPATWVGLMDASGIKSAIVLRGRSIDNAGLLEAARTWPDRLIPFLSVSPEHREYRPLWESDALAVEREVETLLSVGGYYGIGEISAVHFPGAGFPEADFDPNGTVMRGIMNAARRHGVPVMAHVEVTRLAAFEELLADFRDVTMIWAHGGYTDLFLAARMLERHDNLIYELSARTWRRHPRSPDYTILMDGEVVWQEWLALVERLPDRFVVGTDASLRSLESDQRKVDSVQDFLVQLSPEARSAVANDNLERIIGGRN
jgi:predicted TIM-barrel fold metal-dependent hydrolase